MTAFTQKVLKRAAHLCMGVGYLVVALSSLVPGKYRPHIDGLSGKEEHALAYLVLGALTVIGTRPNVKLDRLCLLIVAYAGVLEVLQNFAPDRHPAVGDFIASSLGGITGIVLTAFTLSRSARV